MGDSYALIGLAVLTRAAIKVLLPRPNRWGPGTAGTLAAPHQELRPVPSQTRDDAHVPAAHDPGGLPVRLAGHQAEFSDTSSGGVRPASEGTPK